MPRSARIKSRTGIYHAVMWSGPGLKLFEKPEEYRDFLQLAREYGARRGVEIYAYSLLPDHAHLLVGEKRSRRNADELSGISEFCRCLNTVYAMHYNQSRGRYGRVFAERYKSEPVETRPHFLRVLRNLCREPVYRGLVSHPRDYLWTSYRAIAAGKGTIENLHVIFTQMPQNELLTYLNKPGIEHCMEMPVRRRNMSDESAGEMILGISGLKELAEFGALDEVSKLHYLSLFYNKGIQKQQLCRLLGAEPRLLRRIRVGADPTV